MTNVIEGYHSQPLPIHQAISRYLILYVVFLGFEMFKFLNYISLRGIESYYDHMTYDMITWKVWAIFPGHTNFTINNYISKFKKKKKKSRSS